MSDAASYRQKAKAFLDVAHQFRLGELITEQPHPRTRNLSILSQENPLEALRILHTIDTAALETTAKNLDKINSLAGRIHATLDAGSRVFLCGCGATGRLSLACEVLWRSLHQGDPLESKVCAFMAGGDVALIRSIENFEDHPEYGARMLDEMGFCDGDLCVGSSEGGETAFVIGATNHAAEISNNKPFFLYCNPDDLLRRLARRSAEILDNERIAKINLTVGPMALAGSTRMQASTVLMTALGAALLWHDNPEALEGNLNAIRSFWQNLDTAFLAEFIAKESSCYLKGDYLLYETEPSLAISILTDTTERSPTFSMFPFENTLDRNPPLSLCYLCLPEASDSASAWKMLLGRAPRTLGWEHLGSIASYEKLLGYDLSALTIERRVATVYPAVLHPFRIKLTNGNLTFGFEECRHEVSVGDLSTLGVHCVLKMLLNTHSTLVMGRMGRYENNIMTWVRPANNKLIDRAIRYIDLLLKSSDIRASYDEIALKCFELMESIPADRSLVVETASRFINK